MRLSLKYKDEEERIQQEKELTSIIEKVNYYKSLSK